VGPVLSVSELLDSVQRSFPLLMAVVLEAEMAAGQRLAAEGAFDLGLNSRGSYQAGSFTNGQLDTWFEQPTLLNGSSVYAGYRYSTGDFPVYYGQRKTGSGGELRAGLLVPLLRNGAIDPARAALWQAQINERLADPVIQRAKLDFLRNATRAYWAWVAAGEQVRIATEFERLAEQRLALAKAQFDRQAARELDYREAQRQIAQRQHGVAQAMRRLQQAALDLSLFLRDVRGEVRVPDSSRLPSDFLARSPADPDRNVAPAIETALARRPELVRFRLLKERLGIDQELARNQMFPELNAGAGVAQDLGTSQSLGPGAFGSDKTQSEVFLQFRVPAQRRVALGRLRFAQALQAQIAAQEQFTRDQIVADVRDAASALQQELTYAERAAEIERDAFRAGNIQLVVLNLREQFAADAKARIADALADYYRAEADFRAAIGAVESPSGGS
jgi:outer membrane protein TolC